MIDQLETYFKVEMAVPNTQLKKDENELKAPEKKEMLIDEAPKKKGKWNYLKSWFTMKTPKPAEQESEEEEDESEVLATRFVTFHEGSCIVLQYLPLKPMRDYGPFKPPADEAAKPLPVVQWDS